jgi:hypothetical protein
MKAENLSSFASALNILELERPWRISLIMSPKQWISELMQTKAGEAKSWQSESTRLDDEVEVLIENRRKRRRNFFNDVFL